MVSIGRNAEEIHANLLAEGQDVTLAEVEEALEAMLALNFIERADLSVGEAVEIVQQDETDTGNA